MRLNTWKFLIRFCLDTLVYKFFSLQRYMSTILKEMRQLRVKFTQVHNDLIMTQVYKSMQSSLILFLKKIKLDYIDMYT